MFRVVLQTRDELFHVSVLEADLVDGREQRKPAEIKGATLVPNSHVREMCTSGRHFKLSTTVQNNSSAWLSRAVWVGGAKHDDNH